MIRSRSIPIVMLAVALCSVAMPSEKPITLIVCAPGFPSNTEQAQPSMDELARAVEQAVDWPAGEMRAVYHPTLDGGLQAVEDEQASLALVPLPLYYEHGRDFGLKPMLEVVQASGEDEVWALMAAEGTLTGPDGLAGWELTGLSAYSERFVRELALADWGRLPGDVKIGFTRRPVTALRRAAAGERVAVLLDAAQTAALPQLHFASGLEVVTRSRPMAGVVLCAVGERLPEADRRALLSGFTRLTEVDGGSELLAGFRIKRFRPLAEGRLPEIE